MYTNVYLAEELARQRRQQFLDAAAQNRLSAQLPRTRWRSVQQIFQVLKARMKGGTRWDTQRLFGGE